MTVELHLADCREVMREMEPNSVDAIVSDPPYELNFMGANWDASGIAFDRTVWTEALRVLKPGGYVLAFGATRTWHWLACALELSGFESRGSIAWIQGQGMQHGLDISKAMDAERDDTDEIRVVCRWLRARMEAAGQTAKTVASAFGFNSRMVDHWAARDTDSQPTLPTLEQWDKLRALLGFGDEMDAEVLRLNLRKGERGDAWADREVMGKYATDAGGFVGMRKGGGIIGDITAPATDEAKRWAGWGTQLAPKHEPIAMFRKPLDGTYVENVRAHGVGGLNVDACRLEGQKAQRGARNTSLGRMNDDGWKPRLTMASDDLGRWPPNVALDEAAAAQLDAMVGKRTSGARSGKTYSDGDRISRLRMGDESTRTHSKAPASEHGPSAFFFCPKSPTGERDKGCEHLRWAADERGKFLGRAWAEGDRVLASNGNPIRNPHNTVKPLALMRWLVRLVTPPGGTVLDPFLGSGTTGVAAVCEGFRFVGSDITPWAFKIADARIRWAQGYGPTIDDVPDDKPIQASLFR